MRMLRIATLLIAASAAASLLSLGGPVVVDRAVASYTDDQSETIDRVVLRSGRIVEGQILEESDAQIEMLIVVAGISAPTTYQRSEILSIERDVAVEAEASARPSRSPERDRERPARSSRPDRSGAAIFHLELEGDLGRDITKTPLQRAMDEINSHNPDVVVISMDCGSQPPGFDGLFVAEDLAPIIEETMRNGTRVVFWIKRAEAGAAFLPMISPEIYFRSNGEMGGVDDLGDFNIGDDVVNLKQISLRLGHAEGIAIKGGYNPILIRAMAIKETWLAARWRGGEPEFLTWEPRPEDGEGWVVLTDDGKGKNKDEYSFDGNDILSLDADLAFNLLVSKGAVDLLDDLVFELDLGRDYHVIEGRAGRILSDWSDRIDRSEDELRRLSQRLDEAGRGRGGRDAAATLGAQINILRQMRSVLTAYEEVFDPNGAQRAQIDVRIEELRSQIRQANRRNR